MKLERITHNRFASKSRFLLALVLVLVAIVLILILVGALGSPSGQNGIVASSTIQITQLSQGSIGLSQGPDSAYDFCETGSVVFNNTGSGNDSWLMLYRPQNNSMMPEQVVMLAFDAQSMCAVQGQSRLCEPGILLESGANVQVKGMYTKGSLLVRSVTAAQ